MNITPLIRRRILIVAAVFVLFSVTGFVIAPPIVKAELEKRLSAELGRRVTVGHVKVNPYSLSLTLENFAIQESDGSSQFLGWDRLYVNFDALASLRGEWVLSDIALDGFSARVAIKADRSFNFSDLLAKFAPPAVPGAIAAPPAKRASRPIRVVSLTVNGARVAFSDASRPAPFATTLGPLSFSLTGFRTVSEHGAPYRFEAVTEANEKLSWTGALRADPLSSTGEFALGNIVLAKYAPYYADQINADITAGTLSLRGRYELNLADPGRAMRLLDGALQVHGLKLAERNSKATAVDLPDFTVSGVQADALTFKASIASVMLTGGTIHARREKDGTINLLTMLRPASMPTPVPALAGTPAPAAAPAGAAPAKPDFTIGEVAVKGLGLDIADLAAPRATQLGITDLQVSLKQVTLAPGAQMPLHAAFGWTPKGTVQLDGTVAISPVKADLKVAVAGLELLPLSPYLEQFAAARLTQGSLTVTLDAHGSVPEAQPVDASVTGDVQIEKLGLVDAAHNEELAGFGALSVRGLRASTAPELSVAVGEINVVAPFARIIVNADHTLNVASVLNLPPPGAAPIPATPAVRVTGATLTPVAAPTAAATGPAPKIEIGKVVISDGDYRFTDRSIEPNVRMALGKFAGEITGLSSTNPGKGAVNLTAVVNGGGPIGITGKLDPFGAKRAVDLKIDFKNMDLLPLSPYSGKFAGYELARGKLLVDVKLLVDGSKIDASNVITLNQFAFGNAVASPDATKLPVRLGVALLKDLDGNIVIDVPVQGDLADPNFAVGRVVLRVVVNLLTKAAASPFKLLGAAFGGGGDELAFQEFAPGSAELQPAEVKKLETMVKALTNRPGLNLALAGNFDATADAYALRRAKLAEQVRRAIWEKKHQGDPNIPPPAALAITADEHAAMIKKLFDEKFPPGTKFGTPVPPPPAVVAPPPPPASFFHRVMTAITFQAQRDQRATRRENARVTAEHEKAVAAAVSAGLPLEEMTGRLAEAITIGDNDLRALAEARAQQVRDYLATVGKIAPERLFLTQEKTDTPADSAGKGPRVFLTLQ